MDKLVKECKEGIDGNKMPYNETLDVIPLDVIPLNIYKKVCSSRIMYIILFVLIFMTSICISSVFIYFYWYLKKDNVWVKFNPSIQTAIY